MIFVGHAVLFFLAGFAQFNWSQNRGALAAFIFIVIVSAGLYFLGWWSILTFMAGGIVGGKLTFDYRRKLKESRG